eukprot:gb/GEZN01011118.1/.p1 GENE.gb/GEZN01011118.1/~~gb/GEZN01011118.1/.p1  ORF type:complete len:221 (+),score=16.95 gb/GEZN01011118.1/:29-691(+)
MRGFVRNLGKGRRLRNARPILTCTSIPCEHPILRKRVALVQEEEFGTLFLKELIKDLKESIVNSTTPADGLAAPQIGIDKAIFMLNIKKSPKGPNNFVAYINPEMKVIDSREMKILDCCLSVPNLWGRTLRHAGVEVQARRVDGSYFKARAYGHGAHVLQHEVDHLLGRVFTDVTLPGPPGIFDSRELDQEKWLEEFAEEYYDIRDRIGGLDIVIEDIPH